MSDRITTQDLVNREVLACVSSLVSTLAQGYGAIAVHGDYSRDIYALTEQAYELARPVEDWKEAASQAGMTLEAKADGLHVLKAPADSDMSVTAYDSSEQAAIAFCDFNGLEPYEWEVYEHWIVSDWLADKLIEQGEKVDKDFSGLCVWARTTTGQAISMDAVIERIHAKLLEG